MTVHGRTLQRIRATTIAAVIGMTALVAAESPQPVLAANGSISVTSVTRLSTVRSFRPQISADGRFAAFSDISGAGGVRVAEIGVAGSIQVALNGQGQVADNAFNTPEGFSADGRHLVIVGEAGNLTPTDTLRRYRVYTLDRDADGNGVFDEPGFTTLRRVPGRVAAGADAVGQGPRRHQFDRTLRSVHSTRRRRRSVVPAAPTGTTATLMATGSSMNLAPPQSSTSPSARLE